MDEFLSREIPPTRKTADGIASLVVRWSVSEQCFIAGYGVRSTLKKGDDCGRGSTMTEAVVDLIKK